MILYSKEINALSIENLESPKWTIKHTAALTIADVVVSSGSEISGPSAAAIWPALEKALALKTFDGKEKVLEAFVKFTKAGSSLWNAEPSIAAQMKKIAMREAKRQNDVYRPHAFTSLGEYSEARTDIDMFNDVYSIVVCASSNNRDASNLIPCRHQYLRNTPAKIRWIQVTIRKGLRSHRSRQQ